MNERLILTTGGFICLLVALLFFNQLFSVHWYNKVVTIGMWAKVKEGQAAGLAIKVGNKRVKSKSKSYDLEEWAWVEVHKRFIWKPRGELGHEFLFDGTRPETKGGLMTFSPGIKLN